MASARASAMTPLHTPAELTRDTGFPVRSGNMRLSHSLTSDAIPQNQIQVISGSQPG